MLKDYIFEENDIGENEQKAIIELIQTEELDSEEVIARAFEWLDKRDFLQIIEWWKTHDYKPMIFGGYNEECDKFIIAIEKDFEVVIAWWEC